MISNILARIIGTLIGVCILYPTKLAMYIYEFYKKFTEKRKYKLKRTDKNILEQK